MHLQNSPYSFFQHFVILCYFDKIGMVHPDNISRELATLVDVCTSIDGVVANVADVGSDFSSKQDFDDRESMITWIRKNATNLGFGVVIGRSDMVRQEETRL